MGRIPSDSPGQILILEADTIATSADGEAWTYIDITCLDDARPRYIRNPRSGSVEVPDPYAQWLCDQHYRETLQREETARVLRENRVGAGLMIACIIASVAALWGAI